MASASAREQDRIRELKAQVNKLHAEVFKLRGELDGQFERHAHEVSRLEKENWRLYDEIQELKK